jgi:hypothetical protein
LSTGDKLTLAAGWAADHAGPVLDELTARQAGIVTRAQALAVGLTDATLRAHVRAGRWQRVFTGVFYVHSGPLPRASELWAVVLRAGAGAVLSHQTAGELAGLCDPAAPIHVMVPASRRVTPITGVVVHCSSRVASSAQPNRDLPRTRVEETVIDLTQSANDVNQAVGWITTACGRRLTTSARIFAVMATRKKLRWRRLLTAVVDDTAAGCHSVLERRYLHDVERAHGLPRGRRQALRRVGRVRRYEDVRYDEFGTSVELDGRAAHPEELRWLDRQRDNEAAEAGDLVLHYGWRDLARPCASARQVAGALRAGGWRGRPRRCRRPACMIPKTFRRSSNQNSSGS